MKKTIGLVFMKLSGKCKHGSKENPFNFGPGSSVGYKLYLLLMETALAEVCAPRVPFSLFKEMKHPLFFL